MQTILPKIRVKRGDIIGNNIYISFSNLVGNRATYITNTEAVGQTTLSVADSAGFSANDYIVIGNIGDYDCEIGKISSVGTGSITIGTATKFQHNTSTPITFIPFNQIVLSYSTDGISYSPDTAVDINPNLPETLIRRTSDTASYYYKARFLNSHSSAYSDYSDVLQMPGYADNTVWGIKNRALDQMNEKISDLITDTFLNDALWEARRALDEDENVKRWPFRFKYNERIGEVIPGTNTITIPVSLRAPSTNENIRSLRIGRYNRPVTYQDGYDFQFNFLNVAKTTLATTCVDTDVTLVLTNSGDFDESGTIYVQAADGTGTIDEITYTANNEATNTLSGVTGIATGGHTAGVLIWQNVRFNEPIHYTVDPENGEIVFSSPFSNDIGGEGIYMDYYSVLPERNSDADILDEPEYDLFVNYLKWKIKYKKANGKIDITTDPDYQEWLTKKKAFITKQNSGQKIRLIPKIYSTKIWKHL